VAEQSKPTPPNSCSGCGASWTGVTVAHCAADGCHQTFASPGLFDQHRETTRDLTDQGRCLNPASIRHNGTRVMFFRDGMWRGPQLSAEAAARLKASR
jgi:hypothetical protein